MFGIILLYFIGRRFYALAQEYEKHKWGIAVLGIATYYAGTFFAGVILALYYELATISSIEDVSDLVINLIAIPFGLAFCFGLYKLLQSKWKRNFNQISPDIIDDEQILQEKF